MLSQYNKATELWRKNDVDNESEKVSLSSHSELVKEGAYQQPVVLFTKDNMDEDKNDPVVNLPPMRFLGYPTMNITTGNIQGAWYTKILVSVTTTVGAPVEEALADIGMKSQKVVIHMECYGEASWVR